MWSSNLILGSLMNIALWNHVTADPLLSTINGIPELSTFSMVLNGTGGSSGEPGPDIEERFNSVLDGRKFTAFVPTNAAFSKISADVLKVLTAATSYSLLLTIIRTHIAEGIFSEAELTDTNTTRSIQGFSLDFEDVGDSSILDGQASVYFTNVSADNDLVHQIDQVLNPYTAYFGISNATAQPVAAPDAEYLSIADIVAKRPDLSDVASIVKTIDPDFLTLLSQLDTDTDNKRVLFAPSNDAFTALPPGALDSFVAPFNEAISAFLIRHHLTTIASQDIIGSVQEGQSFASTDGLPVVISGEGGSLRASNAAIQVDNLCSPNGCVIIVDKLLDPLYLAFGEIDRIS
ncbi:hypothetical protein PVAG01_00147 [Phlyctema vagabunda]|uniref:FAS1 domain-containing protein n=1 Tax=Phlyctema vagabunda TaxID=108571 RepID=A0ABR4PTW0_9HELO